MTVAPLVHFLLALALAPLLPGIINKVKAFFAGRQGPPVAQLYYDLWKLFGKGATYSQTTTWVFRLGPPAGLACAAVALAVAPLGSAPALLHFPGDLVLFCYVFGMMRFATILAALDTGSAFEGMGASREAAFSALAEPALFLALVVVCRETDSLSLSTMLPAVSAAKWAETGPALALAAAALFVVFLAENCRIPVDDPNTHLELTMIHEVMVLDHGGPDLGLILYAAALKMWTLGLLLAGLVAPVNTGRWWVDALVGLAGLAVVAVAAGVVESIMARLRLIRVPRLLVAATALAALAMFLVR